MVKIKEIRKPKIKEIVSSAKIVESKKPESLESEIESRDIERENGFIAARAVPGGVPLIRQTASTSRKTMSQESSETSIPSRVRELPAEDTRPATYTPRSDAEVYTALSTQNAGTRYAPMHGSAKADDRIATRSRVAAPSPSLGPRGGTIPQERFVGQSQGLPQQDPFTLRSAWQDDTLDKRYDMYREDSLQDANKPRRTRR